MITIEQFRLAFPRNAFITDNEALCLQRFAARASNTIVEIGTGYGASAVLLCYSAPLSARVYSIDSYEGDSHGRWLSSEKAVEDHIFRAAAILERWHELERLTLIAERSLTIAEIWKKPIDLLYIDGDHRYEAVRADVDHWLPFVCAAHGIMILHDSRRLDGADSKVYSRGWPGPTRVAAELVSGDRRVRLIEAVDSMTIWKAVADASEA